MGNNTASGVGNDLFMPERDTAESAGRDAPKDCDHARKRKACGHGVQAEKIEG
jgi:hypothetical protein